MLVVAGAGAGVGVAEVELVVGPEVAGVVVLATDVLAGALVDELDGELVQLAASTRPMASSDGAIRMRSGYADRTSVRRRVGRARRYRTTDGEASTSHAPRSGGCAHG